MEYIKKKWEGRDCNGYLLEVDGVKGKIYISYLTYADPYSFNKDSYFERLSTYMLNATLMILDELPSEIFLIDCDHSVVANVWLKNRTSSSDDNHPDFDSVWNFIPNNEFNNAVLDQSLHLR